MDVLSQIASINSIEIPINQLVFDIVLTALTAAILKLFYVRFGRSISNRQRLADNFVAIAVTTALVITIVKSSLALSLGLVGALSIVRFRTAIKEPEELAYLFLSIALGLGFGAHQWLITLVAFGVILIVLWIQYLASHTKQTVENLYLNITLPNNLKTRPTQLKAVIKLIAQHSAQVDLKKVDHQTKHTAIACRVKLNSVQNLDLLMADLQKTYPQAEIILTDTSSIF